jgi:capsid protein
MGISQGSIDPLKEAQASEKKINLLLSSIEREAIEINGSDWLENVNQGARELEACEERGLIYPGIRTTAYK